MNEVPGPPSADFLAGGGEMGALMRAMDWAATPLGPVELWPQSLRTSVSTCLNCAFPILLWWGPDLVMLCNDEYRPILGDVKHPAAMGQRGEECWPEIWHVIGPMLRRVMETGEAARARDLLLELARNGYPEECYFSFSYSPIRDETGGVGGVFTPVIETTGKVIGERRLRTLKDLAARRATSGGAAEACRTAATTLAENPLDIPFALLYLVDESGTAARLAGTAGIVPGGVASPETVDLVAEPVEGWPLAEAVRTDTAVGVEDLAERFGAGVLPAGAWPVPPAAARILPITLSRGQAPAAVLVAAISPRKALDADYRGFLDLVADQVAAGIAEAVAYEEERRRAEALAEIDRAKTAFFSNVSHEFRTPLTLMLGPLEEVLSRPEYKDGSAVGALVETAHHNGLRLLKLVNSLLDFSRIEAGRVQATYEPTDLAALTAELASSFRSAVDRAGLQLVIDCRPLREPVYVDRDMWEKVVLNLVSNAFKFTFEGEIRVAVTEGADGMAELAVHDTGTGIPAHEVSRVFERFHRIEGARGRTFEGSGIGLALVQELVKLHGGTIRVASELGRGSSFIVALPFGAKHLPADHVGGTSRRATTGIRAQAYVEEALRWLPRDAGSDANGLEQMPSRSAADDLGAPSAYRTGGRVLLADDNADMRDYVCRLVVEQGYEVEAVPDGESALAAARRRRPDLVLSDVMMPRLDGFGLLRALRADPALAEVPVVLLSARAGEEARVEGLDAGADDYLTKPFSARELLARIGANLQMARLRREAAEALRARTAELEAVLETVPTGVWFTRDPRAAHIRGNRQAAAMLRLADGANASQTAPERERPTHYRLFRDGVEATPEMLPIQRAARGEEVRGEELTARFADGTAVVMLLHATPLRDSAGTVVGAVAAAADITMQKEAEAALRGLNELLEERVAAEMARREAAEAALRQAQKMEAVGQLTGGVAHDFYYILHAVQANLDSIDAELAALRRADAERLTRAVRSAQRAVERGAALTQRLLAFARRQPLAPEPTDANTLVAGMSELLRRTLGESVGIETVLAGGLWRTFADRNQLENALLNLAVNARDAMPEGGKLTIETANASLDEDYAHANHDVAVGQYVMIAVTDTGTGMAHDTVERAFEPFFTTKETGRGTGLGLSQVYGFVKQSGGHVKIYSELDQGTTVRIYLPRHIPQAAEEPARAPAAGAVPRARGGETILVVEDDPDVREASVQNLRGLGYRVREAADGPTALRLLEEDPSVELVFTDVGLPGGMNGRQVANEARQRWPGLRVLFTTGYARNAIVHHGRLDPGVELIVKPYTLAALAAKIRAAIDRPA